MENWSTDREFLETFRAEAQERLRNLNEGLMELETSGGDEDTIKKLFREAHTLKGSAGMMGFASIRDLAHHVEDILSSVQKGHTKMSKEVADLLLESLDRIEELLPTGEDDDVEGDVTDLIEKLDGIEGAGAGEAEEEPGDAGRSSQEAQEPQPAPAGGGAEAGEGPAAAKEEDARQTEKIPVAAVSDRPQPRTTGKKKMTDPTIRVHIERLDKLLNLMGEVLVNQLDTEGQVDNLSEIQNQAKELKSAFNRIIEEVEVLRNQSDPEKIEALGHQLHVADEQAEAILEKLDQTTSHLKDNTTNRRIALDELQDRTLHVRMLPLSTIFSLFPRVVRDAAGACGKSVQLVVEGEKTELDKRILEQISDPIMHIIRNCVDHGIELPRQREAAGKPETGTIRLSAEQRGDKVEIEIEDDGAGIDPAKIKKSAVKKGLVAEADELSNEEAIDLIFRTGFSTAGSVTAISGRGVGLDVVKNNIEKLEGTVMVDTVPGQGTRFIVSLPVSLAIFSGLLVESSDSKFVIPLTSVQEMVSIRHLEIQTLGNNRGFLMRGHAIPIVDLLEFLDGGETGAGDEKLNAVIVGKGKNQLALQVGRFLGEQEVVIKSTGSFLPRLPNIAGITILASGEAVIVLNINELVSNIRAGNRKSRAAGRKEAGGNGGKEHRKVHVLVVEDSLVVRELQRNILESAGYSVDTAVDGEDALSHLAKGKFDCIVTDIEMPRMNGFDLTSAVRKNEETKETPVIMVTSLTNDEDKKRGIEVGADAYVVKGTFDQHNLLNTIERLVA